MDYFLIFFGTIFSIIFFSTLSVISIDICYESRSRVMIRTLFIIQLMFLISSLSYFILGNITFSSNFIKHSVNILPSILLLVSFVYFFALISKITVDWAVVFGLFFLFFLALLSAFPILWGSILSEGINKNIINNEKELLPENSPASINIKSEKNLFNVSISIDDEDICDRFAYNIYNKSLKNDKNISFKIKDIIVNNKKFDNTKFLCQSKHNTINYKIEKV